MGKLHLFFPENDLALARNLEHYTAPPAAIKLRISGALLGMWYGAPGDMVVDYGTDSRWYDSVRTRYALAPAIYDGSPDCLAPAPWGWSKASRLEFVRLGFGKESLPSDEELDVMRSLSHRRTAAIIADALASVVDFPLAPASRELATLEDVDAYVHATGESVLKLPWSSSGRGIVLCSPSEFDSHRVEIEGLLNRQGSLMGEPRMKKTLDFALLFTMTNGKCHFDGYSLFRTVQFGSYAGNMLAPQRMLHDEIAGRVPVLDRISEVLPAVLEEIIGTGYDGPLGIDMMAVDGAPYCVAPAVELNLRMTMGHVCRMFYERHVVEGHRGTFTVTNRDSGIDDTVLEGNRIYSGRLSLSPPHSPFSFEVCLEA